MEFRAWHGGIWRYSASPSGKLSERSLFVFFYGSFISQAWLIDFGHWWLNQSLSLSLTRKSGGGMESFIHLFMVGFCGNQSSFLGVSNSYLININLVLMETSLLWIAARHPFYQDGFEEVSRNQDKRPNITTKDTPIALITQKISWPLGTLCQKWGWRPNICIISY